MFIRNQTLPFGDAQHLGEEALCHRLAEQALAVGAEGRMVPHGFVEAHPHEPAVEQVVVDVLNQLALGADREQRLDQAGAQQALRGDGGAAPARIQRLEIVVHAGQDGVDQHPQLAQRMRIRDAFFQRAVAVQGMLGGVGLAHDGGGKIELIEQRLQVRAGWRARRLIQHPVNHFHVLGLDCLHQCFSFMRLLRKKKQ